MRRAHTTVENLLTFEPPRGIFRSGFVVGDVGDEDRNGVFAARVDGPCADVGEIPLTDGVGKAGVYGVVGVISRVR